MKTLARLVGLLAVLAIAGAFWYGMWYLCRIVLGLDPVQVVLLLLALFVFGLYIENR